MNTFFKPAWLGIKLLISLILVLFAVIFAFASDVSDPLAQIVGSFLFFFIALITIFIFFFKKKFLTRWPQLKILWWIILVIYLICVAYILFYTGWGFIRMDDKGKTQETVNFINSQKIDLNDVMGSNLPPKPDQTLNDSTIAGIDANNNYIRDDVELAIFEKYPNSAKIRAAELQYAQALQLELTQVFNSETLVEVLRKRSYGQSCISEAGSKIDTKDSKEEKIAIYAVNDERQEEVESLVLNTEMRKSKQSDGLNRYMTSYLISPRNQCDINLSSLPN